MPGCTVLAPCGIDCAECERYFARQDPGVAQQLPEGVREEGRADDQSEGAWCKGCRRDSRRCLTGDCRLYQCSVEEKGLLFCSDCETFPCSELAGWADGEQRQQRALETLRVLYGSYTLGPPPN